MHESHYGMHHMNTLARPLLPSCPEIQTKHNLQAARLVESDLPWSAVAIMLASF
jgi:hypothetical protein